MEARDRTGDVHVVFVNGDGVTDRLSEAEWAEVTHRQRDGSLERVYVDLVEPPPAG